MSLISKPFDDSGVDMVDDIARYGLSITKQIEQFRQRNRLRAETANSLSGLDITLVLCDTLNEIIDTSSYEPYRSQCARAADTIFFESVSEGCLPCGMPSDNHPQSGALIQEVNAILADDRILPADGSLPIQTVLLALVWSALSFAMESLPAEEARAYIRERITNAVPSASCH